MQNTPKGFSAEDARRLAATATGQKLIAALKNANKDTLQDAVNMARSGDLTKAKQALSPLLESEEIQKLLKQLGGK